MSASGIRFEQPGRPDLKITHTNVAASERAERTTAILVLVLTLACTVLALYDLLLLASHA
jgi:hypothetical protein